MIFLSHTLFIPIRHLPFFAADRPPWGQTFVAFLSRLTLGETVEDGSVIRVGVLSAVFRNLVILLFLRVFAIGRFFINVVTFLIFLIFVSLGGFGLV